MPALPALPVGALVVTSAAVLAWQQRGSIAAVHWLPVGILATLLVAVLATSGAARRPERLALVGLSAVTALAGFAAASLAWSPLPTLARDEGLLTLTYAAAFAVTLLSLRGRADRVAATMVIAATSGLLAVATALKLVTADDPEALYRFDRLNFPVGYANAVASIFLIGLWPAIVLAAQRALPTVVRAFAFAAGTACAAGWLLTQSKGGALGVVVSTAVVLAVVPARLRLLVPLMAIVALTAAGAVPLTKPYRSPDAVSIPGAGAALLVLTSIALLVGFAYAWTDTRVRVSLRARRVAGAVVAAFAVAAAAALLAAIGRPDDAVGETWTSFKAGYETEEGQPATHLLSFGSARYDTWRVSLEGFADHPVAGIGARGFGPLYLTEGRSDETPARAHSLVFEVLLEQGVIGFLLLAIGLGAPLVLVARAARSRRLHAVAALGGCVAWIAHASVDWIWTFPASGIPFFCLLGMGASGDRTGGLGRARAPLTAASAALALFLLAPPYLAARLVTKAIAEPTLAERDLRRARRLDPISVDPLLARAQVVPGAALEALAEAASKEPRSVRVRYLYGLALLGAQRPVEARHELEAAERLSPGEPLIELVLSSTPSAEP